MQRSFITAATVNPYITSTQSQGSARRGSGLASRVALTTALAAVVGGTIWGVYHLTVSKSHDADPSSPSPAAATKPQPVNGSPSTVARMSTTPTSPPAASVTSATEMKPTGSASHGASATPAAVSASVPSKPAAKKSKKVDEDDEDDDLFAVPNGPRLFAPDVVFPHRSAAETLREGGGGSRNQRPGFVAPVTAAQQASITAAAAQRKHQKHIEKDTGGHKANGAKESEVWTTDIVERAKVLNLVRALLKRIEGIDYDESDDDETDSDTTDVSLNYKIATDLELTARDELLAAFVECDDKLSGAESEAIKAGEEPPDPQLEDFAMMLAKAAEYLDISNEREKLRVRREAMHFANGTWPPEDGPFRHAFSDPLARMLHHDANDDDDDLEHEADTTRYRETLQQKATKLSNEYAAMLSQRVNEMDRRLQQQQQQPQHHHAGRDAEERFEDGWGDEDGEEAAFMAYLQQDDSALHVFTRDEMRAARQRRRSSHDVHVVGANGMDFNEELDKAPFHDSEDDDDAWIDEDDTGYEEFDGDADFNDDGDDGDDDDDEDEAEPWNDEEKAEFEEDLVERVRDIAEMFGVTEAMGEREAVKEEEERRKHREEKAHRKTAPSASTAVGASMATATAAGAAASRPTTKGATRIHSGSSDAEGEWEDAESGDSWQDEEEDQPAHRPLERFHHAAHTGTRQAASHTHPKRATGAAWSGEALGVSASTATRPKTVTKSPAGVSKGRH